MIFVSKCVMRHTMLSTDDMSISKGVLNAHLLPFHFQIRSTLIYLKVIVNNSHYFIITELCTNCENLVADHQTLQLLCSCSEPFWHMQSRFPHELAQMHHVQIRDLRVTHSPPLCLLIDVETRLLKRNTLRQK